MRDYTETSFHTLYGYITDHFTADTSSCCHIAHDFSITAVQAKYDSDFFSIPTFNLKAICINPYYNKSAALTLPEPTDNVLTLCKIATHMIDDLYQKDIGFKKCGVILTCLEPKVKHTYDLFIDMKQITAGNKLMDSLEAIHHKFGKTKLTFGANMLPNRTWNMSRDQLSQNYFRWDQLLCVK